VCNVSMDLPPWIYAILIYVIGCTLSTCLHIIWQPHEIEMVLVIVDLIYRLVLCNGLPWRIQVLFVIYSNDWRTMLLVCLSCVVYCNIRLSNLSKFVLFNSRVVEYLFRGINFFKKILELLAVIKAVNMAHSINQSINQSIVGLYSA